MLIDTHAHLNFEAYNFDRPEIIKRCQEKPMAVINVGAQLATSQSAVKLANEYDGFFASVGLHPIHVFDEEFNEALYQSLINKKMVAIGETGFDYYHPTFGRAGAKDKTFEEIIAKQKEIFLKHIILAKKNNLALICHGRNGVEGKDAYQDILDLLIGNKVERAVIHCYGGSLGIAKKIIRYGYYIGIDGPVTFKKKAEDLQQLAKEIPLENILLETDSPYLTPEPHRGKRNEPVYVEYVAAQIAGLKGIAEDEVIERTWQNAKSLFRL
jgi:TatD DNase family protein